MNRIDVFEKNYNDALATIEYYLTQQPNLSKLVQWMLTTDVNPYEWLDTGIAHRLSSAEGFVSIVQMISHAVHDDGDIAFVRVNGMPRIVFYYAGEPDFEQYALTDQEQQLGNNKVEVLDIKPNEFGELVEQANTAQIKRCFVNDVVALGEKMAVAHYMQHSCFSTDWLTELAEQIEKRKQRQQYIDNYSKNS